MNIQRKNSAHHFRMQSEREQTLVTLIAIKYRKKVYELHSLAFFCFIIILVWHQTKIFFLMHSTRHVLDGDKYLNENESGIDYFCSFLLHDVLLLWVKYIIL